MKTVARGSGSGGVFELTLVRFHPVWSDRPKNLDSNAYELVLQGIFDRFENFSFWVKLGRSEVEVQPKIRDFPL